MDKISSRPSTPSASRELQLATPDQLRFRSGSPTPTAERKDDNGKSKVRPLPNPLGQESTPPSTNALALRNLNVADDLERALRDMSNGTKSPGSQDSDKINEQMRGLTSIANTLQTEMSALVKRSRDNATDLMSLKKAATSRDEHIKTSLEELVGALETVRSGLGDLQTNIGSELSLPAQSVTVDLNCEAIDNLQDSLNNLRDDVVRMSDKPVDLSVCYDILETVKDGLTHVRSDLDKIGHAESRRKDEGDSAGSNVSYEILDTLRDGLANVSADLHHLKSREPKHETEKPVDTAVSHEILDTLKEGLANIQGDLDSLSSNQPSKNTVQSLDNSISYEILDTIKDGLANVQGELDALKSSQTSREVAQTADTGMSNEILEALKDGLANINEELGSLRAQQHDREPGQPGEPTVSYEVLEALKDGFANVHEELESQRSRQPHREQDQTEEPHAPHEVLDALRDGFANIHGELESLKNGQPIQALTQSADMTVSYEILDTLKEGLSNVRADLDQCKSGEVLDALNDHLTNMRVDLDRLKAGEILDSLKRGFNDVRTDIDHLRSADSLDTLKETMVDVRREVEQLRSAELMDTLKDGLASLRADLEDMKTDHSARQVVLADSAQEESSLKDPSPDSLSRSDIERLEVMLAQLQIKIEALDQNIGAQPNTEANPDVAVKADLVSIEASLKADLIGVEASLKDLQSSMTDLASKETPAARAHPDGVSKEDVDALETLMQNIKAKIDDNLVPGIETIVTKEDLDNVEALARMTHEAVEAMSGRLGDEKSPKEDIEALALLVHDTTAAVNSIKEKLESPEHETKLKDDMNIIRDVCDDIKLKLDDVPSGMPTKDDLQELSEMLGDLRDSQQSLKDKYEGDISITARAFDDRKDESAKIMELIEDLRGSIDETRDHLKSRIKRGNEDVRVLDEILQGIEEKIDDIPSTVPDVDDFKTAMESEVAKAVEAIESVRSDHEGRCATILEKSEEHRTAIVNEMLSKLDVCFDDMKSRQQEQQQVIGEATLTMTEKQKEQEEMMSSSKIVAEELKVTIDTLGASVQGIDPALREATEKWSDDAKTVFAKVDDMSNKLEEGNVDSKTHHQLTREEVGKAVLAIGSVHDTVSLNHPQIMGALNTLKAAIDAHQEYFRSSNETSEKISDGLKAHFDEGLRRLPAPQIEAPKAETVITVDDNVHSKLDEILRKGVPSAYDDAPLHTKLDDLLSHASKSSEASEQLSKLDELQQQLTSTAAEVSAFVAFQAKMISAEHENKEKEADQAALDLSNSLNEKERIDGEIASLREQKHALSSEVASQKAEVLALKGEREAMQKQKLHLGADVSSLEMALKLRREELNMMDARADALERRIIEGVMDHSRALLLAKQPRTRTGPESMNLKRVNSNASHATSSTQTIQRSTTPSVVNVATGMALKARKAKPNIAAPAPANSPRTDRRIASLSQINNNVPVGGRQLATATNRNISTGLGAGLKRSQSVRTQKPRKVSWQPGNGSLQGISDDKENESASEENRSPTPTPAGLEDPVSVSRATSISQHAPASTEATMSRQSSMTKPSPSMTDMSASRAPSVALPPTNTDGFTASRQPSATLSAASGSRRDSFTTVVTGTSDTSDHEPAETPSEYSYATTDAGSSYFCGSNPSVVSNSDNADTESTITQSTDRRRSVGSTMYSNLGSEVGGGDNETNAGDDERIDSEVGTTMVPPDMHSDIDEDLPAPLQLTYKGGPQRAPGPDGYDSGLGSDLPTAALSQGTGSITDYFGGVGLDDVDRLEAVDE